MSPLARVGHLLVRGYQRLFAFRPSSCRYLPTCSNYALDAFEGHGAVKGAWLTIRRIGRCHPWGDSGWDPVPDPGTKSRPAVKATSFTAAADTRSTETLEHRCSI